nr:MAG TPA: hypothetical protein [Caudoviricetes sp.]
MISWRGQIFPKRRRIYDSKPYHVSTCTPRDVHI